MKNNKVRLGLRTLKTGLSVFLCILVFHIFQRQSPMIACLSAVFALRQDVSTSVSFGVSRIVGNLIGGSFGLIYFLMIKRIDGSFYLELIVIPLLVILLIVVADAFGMNAGIIGATATLLMIIFTVPETQSFGYALERVLDTVIGTTIALTVNHLIKPNHNQESENPSTEIDSDSIDQLSLTDLELAYEKQSIEIKQLMSTLQKIQQQKKDET